MGYTVFLVRLYVLILVKINVNIQVLLQRILSSVCVLSSEEAGGTEIPCKNLAQDTFEWLATRAFPEPAGNPRL